MPRPVYSVQFFEGAIAAFPDTTLLVEGDGVNTYIIREMTAWSSLEGGLMVPTSQLTVGPTDPYDVIWTLGPPDAVTGRSYQWAGRYVLSALGQVFASQEGDQWYMSCSGYQLTAT